MSFPSSLTNKEISHDFAQRLTHIRRSKISIRTFTHDNLECLGEESRQQSSWDITMLSPELLLSFPSLSAEHQCSTDPNTTLTYSEQSAWLHTLLEDCLELEFTWLLLCRHLEKEATQFLWVKMAEKPLLSSIHLYQTF